MANNRALILYKAAAGFIKDKKPKEAYTSLLEAFEASIHSDQGLSTKQVSKLISHGQAIERDLNLPVKLFYDPPNVIKKKNADITQKILACSVLIHQAEQDKKSENQSNHYRNRALFYLLKKDYQRLMKDCISALKLHPHPNFLKKNIADELCVAAEQNLRKTKPETYQKTIDIYQALLLIVPGEVRATAGLLAIEKLKKAQVQPQPESKEEPQEADEEPKQVNFHHEEEAKTEVAEQNPAEEAAFIKEHQQQLLVFFSLKG